MNKNFIIVIVVLLLIWGSTFWYIFEYAEELRHHPCNLCARRAGRDVSCSIPGATRIFLENGTIETYEKDTFLPINLTP